MIRKLAFALVALVALFAVAQLVPAGAGRTNPPDGALVAFDSQSTESLAKRACFDCHSNQTKWPWYASIAPMSWRIGNHVREGREKLNFTAFDPSNEEVAEHAGEASETVTKGEMPPRDYLLLHPEARLTAAEKAALAKGLDVTFAAFAEGEEHAGPAGGDATVRAASSEGSAGARVGNGEDRDDREDDDESGEREEREGSGKRGR